MKAELLLLAGVGLTGLILRVLGPPPLADFAALGYLTAATLVFDPLLRKQEG